MSSALRISDELVKEAREQSRIDHRSLTGQIEHRARIGKTAEENPDLTLALIRDILIGMEELDTGVQGPGVRVQGLPPRKRYPGPWTLNPLHPATQDAPLKCDIFSSDLFLVAL
jgi:hypothetical protein